MHKHKRYDRVLSVYLTGRGFAFVLFVSPLSPHDWGTKEAKRDVGGAQSIAALKAMLVRFRPDVLVFDKASSRKTMRSARTERILKGVSSTLEEQSIELVRVERRDVRASFGQFGAVNKLEIARVIASKMEVLAPQVPRERTLWQAEDHRMAVFDAASRGLTYYYRLELAAR